MKSEEILLKLLNFDTQNDDSGNFAGETIELLKFVKSFFNPSLIESEIMEYSIGAFSNRGVLISNPKKFLDLPNVALQGHVDTVPSGEFEGNFFGELKNEFILGRGAVDMKGSVSCFISIFEDIVKNENRNFNPILILTSDEEAKEFAGIKHFLKNNKLKIDFCICGEPSNFKIYDKFRGVTSREIIVKGKSAHGSRPHLGKNAIYDSIKILNLLENFSKYLHENIINLDFETREEYTKKSTLNVGKIVGGNKVNSVPEECKIEFEMRFVYPKERYDFEFKQRVLEEIPAEVDYLQKENFTFDSFVLEKNDFILDLKDSILGFKEGEFGVMTGFSEASITNAEGIPTVIFGVGDSKYSHTSNERINVSDLEIYEKILSDFFLQKSLNIQNISNS